MDYKLESFYLVQLKTDLDFLRFFALAFKLGGGIANNFTKKIALQITMDFNNTISKFYKESDFRFKSFALGIGIIKSV